jgi:integration host factor subunit beta
LPQNAELLKIAQKYWGRSLESDKKTTVTKKNLISAIAAQAGLHPNEVRRVVQALLDQVTEALARGERLEFRDFGVFDVVTRRQKVGRNPKNAAVPIIIPPRRVVKFTPGKHMRQRIGGES